MNRLPFGIGDFVASFKSFNPDQPRDDKGKWTGGSGGRNFENEGEGRTGKYAGQYSGGRSYLTAHMQAAHDAVLDGTGLELTMPIQRQNLFYVRNRETKNSAAISGILHGGYKVTVSKPRIGQLGSSPTISKTFENADDLGKFTVNELSTPRTE